MQTFDPVARGNAADTADDCQMKSCFHVEKWTFKLKSWIKQLINCCFAYPKQVKSLIYLTGYGNIFR